MSMQLAKTASSARQAKELVQDAINMAMNGEWDQAVEANRTILEQFPNQVDTMNRLGKALMELGRYQESKDILTRLVSLAPSNTIAKKNLDRLGQLEKEPSSAKQARKSGRNLRLFIEESGKAGVTVLKNAASGQTVARVTPGDAVNLKFDQNRIYAHSYNDEYLGQVDAKLAKRLNRLVAAGNKYEAAIIGAQQQGISVIIRETYRHPSMRGVYSFPAKAKEENRAYMESDLSSYAPENDAEGEYGTPRDFPGAEHVEYDE